jgi:hypothetical protein
MVAADHQRCRGANIFSAFAVKDFIHGMLKKLIGHKDIQIRDIDPICA